MNIDNTYFIQIPLLKENYNYEFTTIIGESTYILWIYFNRRMGRWILNVKDENNDPLVMGIPVLIGAQMLSRFAGSKLEDIKILFAFNKKSQYEEIGEYDLGDNGSLYVARELA